MGQDQDRARQVASAAGLQKLDERHLAQLARSIQAAADLGGRLPNDLHWSEESALVFRLPIPPTGTP